LFEETRVWPLSSGRSGAGKLTGNGKPKGSALLAHVGSFRSSIQKLQNVG